MFPHTEECFLSHMGLWVVEPRRAQAAVSAFLSGRLSAPSGILMSTKPMDPNEVEAVQEAFCSEAHCVILQDGISFQSMSIGRPNTAEVAVVDQIAFIPLLGPLQKGRSSLGGTSTVLARRQIKQAVRDPQVKGILLEVDSPGGHSEGTDELAEEIRRAAEQKPVRAHVQDLMASAAMWVASQAHKITINRAGFAGSIGTFAVLVDQSKALEQMGITLHLVSTGPYKGLGAPGTPVDDKLLAEVRREIDHVNGLFLNALSQGRRLVDDDLKAVTTGQLWPAPEAVVLGLVDEVATFEEAMAQFRADLGPSQSEDLETRLALEERLALTQVS